MRLGVIAFLLALTSCAPANNATNNVVNQTAHENEAGKSAAAHEAQNVVESYFQFIQQAKFLDAYKLWGNRGADTRGTVGTFAATFARYKTYAPEVGEPTEIKISNGLEYIAVPVKLRVTLKADGTAINQSGVVMLRRSANYKEPLADKREWRIWGTDIRARH